MKKFFWLFITALIVLSAFYSCKKEDTAEPPIPKNELPGTPIPENARYFFKSSVFHVSSINAYGQSTEYKIGDAFAFFKNDSDVKISAGELTINGLPLSLEQGNYVYKKLGNFPEGVPFTGNTATWTASGDTAGVPPFSINDNSPFPAKPVILDKKINTQENFLLAARDTIIADSTIFIIAGPKGSLKKVKGPNSRSCLFSKDELKTIGTGRSLGLIQISAYNTVSDTLTFPGILTFFQKQTTASKYVDLE
ncbi:MAG: hypothetical protein RMJ53_06930 [Chitinophagales bacterium]|nr:hypothetical protein [Chitinophagales bacterium]MDW8273944.1 hypothetical protein [Chitinophagales bacterium]